LIPVTAGGRRHDVAATPITDALAPFRPTAPAPVRHGSPRKASRLRPSLEALELRELMAIGALGTHVAVLGARAAGEITAGAAAQRGQDEALTARAIRPRAKAPALKVLALSGPDTNGSVALTGRGTARAKIQLDIGGDGSIEQTTRANAKGRFQLTF